MSVEETLRLFVPGKPVQQGSKIPFLAGGVAKLRDANATTLRPWRKAVTAAARDALQGREPLVNEPLVVALEFRFVRPISVKRERPHVMPDLDKLIRAVFDSLTDAGVWGDDALVVRTAAEKVYAAEAGVLVRVGRYVNEKGQTR